MRADNQIKQYLKIFKANDLVVFTGTKDDLIKYNILDEEIFHNLTDHHGVVVSAIENFLFIKDPHRDDIGFWIPPSLLAHKN
jgi:hypothetical protein